MSRMAGIILALVFWINALEVPLSLREMDNIARFDEPVTCGVPLPEGRCFDPSVFQVRKNGTPVPGQCGVLNYWADGSIKWLRANFTADVSANASAFYTLNDAGGPVADPAGALSIEENGNLITVNTGVITVTINTQSFHLFEEVRIGGQVVVSAGAGDGGVIKAGNSLYSTSGRPCRKVSWDERGLYKAVLKLRGWYTPSGVNEYRYAYTARLFFTSGSDRVNVQLSVENLQWLDSMRVYLMDRMSVLTSLAITGTQYMLGGDNGAALTGTMTDSVVLNQRSANVFTITGRSNGSRAAGYCDVSDGNHGVAIGVRDFWQLFPKAVKLTKKGIDVRLWTDDHDSTLYNGRPSNPNYLDFGVKKTHDLLFYFHAGTASAARVPEVMNGFTKFVSPRAEYDWMAGTFAYPGFLSPQKPASPVPDYGQGQYADNGYDNRTADQDYGWANFGHDDIGLASGGEQAHYFGKGFRFLLDGNASQMQGHWQRARHLAELRSNAFAQYCCGGLWWWREGDSMTIGPDGKFIKDAVYWKYYNQQYTSARSDDTAGATFSGYQPDGWIWYAADVAHAGYAAIMEFYLLTGDYALRDAEVAMGQSMGWAAYLGYEHPGHDTYPIGRAGGWMLNHLANAYSISRQSNLPPIMRLVLARHRDLLDPATGYYFCDNFSGAGGYCGDRMGNSNFMVSLLNLGAFNVWQSLKDPRARDFSWANQVFWKDFASVDTVCGGYTYHFCEGDSHYVPGDPPPSYDSGGAMTPICAGDQGYDSDYNKDWAICYLMSGDREWKRRLKAMVDYTVNVNPIVHSRYGNVLDYANPALYWAVYETRPDTAAPAAARITAVPACSGEVMITFNVPADASPLREYVVKYNAIAMTDRGADGVTKDFFWRGNERYPLPAPKSAGAETVYVAGLTIGQTCHFAVKSYDVCGNLSPISDDAACLPGTTGAPHIGSEGGDGAAAAFGVSAFPNPFNPAVNIVLKGIRPGSGSPSVTVYGINGSRVADLSGKIRESRVTWNAAGLGSGLYVLKAKYHGKILITKLLRVK